MVHYLILYTKLLTLFSAPIPDFSEDDVDCDGGDASVGDDGGIRNHYNALVV